MFQNPSDSEIKDLLKNCTTIALVGASQNPERASFRVGNFLAQKGYLVYGINPGLVGQTLYGQTVYANIAEVPVPIDMVDIFRNADAAGAAVDEASLLPTLPKLVWMQLEIINEKAALKALSKGVAVVMDRCPKIEITRLGL